MTMEIVSEEQKTDMLDALGVERCTSAEVALNEQIELATRNLVMCFRELGGDELLNFGVFEKQHLEEMMSVARDPARALNKEPITPGSQRAREELMSAAKFARIDTETRSGAARIGDIAQGIIERPKGRVDTKYRLGIEDVFDQVVEAIARIAPDKLDAWPSNDYPACPATEFAMAFVQVVVDRALSRLNEPSERAKRLLGELLAKDHRSLLEKLRTARQWHLKPKDWFEDEGAMIFHEIP